MSCDTADRIERTIAAIYLIVIVALQILSAATLAIQNSAGRGGRIGFYFAFVINIIHELFTGIAVPASLLWAAHELLVGVRALDTLLAAVVGSLWYGPERVQSAIANLCSIRTRRRILIASLGYYHRAAWQKGIDDVDLTSPLRIRRRLRFGPWWSPDLRNAKVFWNGRVRDEQEPVDLVDGQLRVIARQGVAMALSGEFDESSLRVWCAGMIADQARFPCSPLDQEPERDQWQLVFTGLEGRQLKESFEEHGKKWEEAEWKRIGSVAEGIRARGLAYVREARWLE